MKVDNPYSLLVSFDPYMYIVTLMTSKNGLCEPRLAEFMSSCSQHRIQLDCLQQFRTPRSYSTHGRKWHCERSCKMHFSTLVCLH